MKVVISGFTEQPLEDGEELGMPTWRVSGKINGKAFCVDVSTEIDGRDCEYGHVSGHNIADDFDAQDFFFAALCDDPKWNEAFQKKSDEYFAANAD